MGMGRGKTDGPRFATPARRRDERDELRAELRAYELGEGEGG